MGNININENNFLICDFKISKTCKLFTILKVKLHFVKIFRWKNYLLIILCIDYRYFFHFTISKIIMINNLRQCLDVKDL